MALDNAFRAVKKNVGGRTVFYLLHGGKEIGHCKVDVLPGNELFLMLNIPSSAGKNEFWRTFSRSVRQELVAIAVHWAKREGCAKIAFGEMGTRCIEAFNRDIRDGWFGKDGRFLNVPEPLELQRIQQERKAKRTSLWRRMETFSAAEFRRSLFRKRK